MAAPVSRAGLADVGNFAAISSGSARALIPQMTHALHHASVRWVLFAATRGLRNTFDRLQLRPLVLAPALQSRLRDDETPTGAVTTPSSRRWHAATLPPAMPVCWSDRRCIRSLRARAWS